MLKFGQKCFLVEKRALPIFKYSNIPINYHHVKNQKKTFLAIPKKNAELADGQINGQKDNSDFIRPCAT